MKDNKLYIETTEGWLVYIALNNLPLKNVMDLCLDNNRNIRSSAISNLIEKKSLSEIRKIFNYADNLCASNSFKKREVGVLLLGELGYKHDHPYKTQSITIFKRLINDSSIRVKNAVLISLGHLFSNEILKDKYLIDKVICLGERGKIELLINVAYVLGVCEPNDKVLLKLNELVNYDNEDVSDWAEISKSKITSVKNSVKKP